MFSAKGAGLIAKRKIPQNKTKLAIFTKWTIDLNTQNNCKNFRKDIEENLPDLVFSKDLLNRIHKGQS